MPKPTRSEVGSALAIYTPQPSMDRVMALIDSAWEADERERRAIASRIAPHTRHHPNCFVPHRGCTCGLDEALAELRGEPMEPEPTLDPKPAADVTMDEHIRRALQPLALTQELIGAVMGAILPVVRAYVEPGDAEGRYNALQRARREGFFRGRMFHSTLLFSRRALDEEAAREFPLRKRVSRVAPDPHGMGEWRYATDDESERVIIMWRPAGTVEWGPRPYSSVLTAERIALFVDLVANPYTYVDLSEPESDT